MSVRTRRVAKLLQREIAAILALELPQERLVTVTGVRVSNDLGIAYIHVSVMLATSEHRQAALAQLKGQAAQIRKALAQRIRHQMRAMPELRFFLDESLHEVSKMDTLLDTIRAERAQRSGES